MDAVESECSAEAAAAAVDHSLYVVCSGEFAASCSRDWPSQQQLIDVSSNVVSLFTNIQGLDFRSVNQAIQTAQ